MTPQTPPADSLSIRIQDEGGLRIVRLSGSAGTEQVEELERSLREQSTSATKLVLDLSELSFLNSAGLGAIVAAYRRCREGGGALCLAGPRPNVAQVLRVTHLDRLLKTYPNCDAARGALTAPPVQPPPAQPPPAGRLAS